MKAIDSMIRELEMEAETTVRVLSAVPDDKLGWKPHEKSMSLGQLAWHVATIPARISSMMAHDEVELTTMQPVPAPATAAEMVEAFRKNVETAKQNLAMLDEEKALGEFTMKRNGKVAVKAPRIGFARAVLLNHSYHHRGQLSVYLRLLDVPVPAIYGRSADFDPTA